MWDGVAVASVMYYLSTCAEKLNKRSGNVSQE
jgi:hypothetical protein